MEDNKTFLAIIRRIDDMERRVSARLDGLESFKSKIMGGAIVMSFFITIGVELLLKK